MSRFHKLTVADVRRETRDSVSIRLAVPEALQSAFAFTPGQYLTLRAKLDGEDIRRSYSICSGPDDGELRVGIKKVPGGAFSTFANENLKPGDSIEVMPPQGRFTPKPASAGRHVLGIAAGSGITPVLSIIRSILSREPASRVTLIYGNQTSQSVMFAEEIEDLKNRNLGRFAVAHILSREAQDVAVLAGRITTEKLRALANGIVNLASVDEAFLCGPEGMVREAKEALAALGVQPGRIMAELFTTSAPRKHYNAPVSMQQTAETVSRITVTLDGKRHAFDLLEGDASLIDAAERNGIELPYSCKGGMCCTCRCKVESGAAEMALNYSLEDWEMKAGFILSCQARPTTLALALDFDQL
jgi:ring-1,2-phenylacetyl-CoA epoxidase subunit PaaE